MITCFVRYTVDRRQLEAFERYARAWIPLVEAMGGTHHGYFLPGDSESDAAVALFSFPTVDDFEAYRRRRKDDPRCEAAFALAETTGCILGYEAQFMRPILPGGA